MDGGFQSSMYNSVDEMLDASRDAAYRASLRQQVTDMLGNDDPETVAYAVGGAVDDDPLMSDTEFDRAMRGVACRVDAGSRHFGMQAQFQYSHDFETELSNQTALKDVGYFDDANWKEWGNGQARHTMQMSLEALNLFILRYGFHPADDMMEVKRIAINDPWVASFITNPI